MKNLITTTTGNLFNLEGILTHAGDYAGYFGSQAEILLDEVSTKHMDRGNGAFWADIMFNEKTGKVYAVWAVGELTEHNGDCQYIELDEEDCPKAFEFAKQKQDNY